MIQPRHQILFLGAWVSRSALRTALQCYCANPRSLSSFCSRRQLVSLHLVGSLSFSPRNRKSRLPAKADNSNPNTFWHPARRITDCLLIVNAVCFVAQFFSGGKLVKWGVKDNVAIRAGQWWRLLTPAFLHGNLLHFVTNAYSLNNVGPLVERLAGRPRFLSVYALSAAGGCTLSYLCTPSYALGASGAIFGVLGSLAVFLIRHRTQLGPSVADSTLENLFRVAAVNLLIGLTPGIDNWGHLGGVLGGAAAAYLLGPSWSVQGDSLIDRPPLPVFAAKPRRIKG